MCLLFFTSAVFAQVDAPETFLFEQRCVPEPVQPPDEWTYPGVILMSGYAGIHAMQADWETPHVVAFFNNDAQGNAPMVGGQLSPDQNWYAMPMGQTYQEISYNIYFFIETLHIYSLSGDGVILDFNLGDYFDIAQIYGYAAWVFFPVQWRDDQSLIIGGLLMHPFTGEGETSSFDLVSSFNRPYFAPDLSRAWLFDAGTGSTNVYDPLNWDVPERLLGGIQAVFWRHDSSGFIGFRNRDREVWRGLINYDRDGIELARVLNMETTRISTLPPLSGRTDLQWSRDDRYFAFATFSSDPPNTIYLVDMQERLVTDTCLEPRSAVVWSSDGTLFAYLAESGENLNVVVVDTTTWQAYIVARHSGQTPAFGAIPEMVGWRDTTND